MLAQKPFSYDPSADPLYHHYAAAYTRGGKQAMEDTLASAAALTGGYGSSYATRHGGWKSTFYAPRPIPTATPQWVDTW